MPNSITLLAHKRRAIAGYTLIEAVIAATSMTVLVIMFVQGARFFHQIYFDNDPIVQMKAIETDNLSVLASQDSAYSVAAYASDGSLLLNGDTFMEGTFTPPASPWLTSAEALAALTASYGAAGKVLTLTTTSASTSANSVLFVGKGNRIRAHWMITCVNSTVNGKAGLQVQIRRYADNGGLVLVPAGRYDDFIVGASVSAPDRNLERPGAASLADGSGGVRFVFPRPFNSARPTALTGTTSLEGANYRPLIVVVRPDFQPRSL